MKKHFKILILLVAMIFCLHGTVFTAVADDLFKISTRPGGYDDEYYGIKEKLKKDKNNKKGASIVYSGGLSKKYVEELLNEGYLDKYIDDFKDAGIIPEDFVPKTEGNSSKPKPKPSPSSKPDTKPDNKDKNNTDKGNADNSKNDAGKGNVDNSKNNTSSNLSNNNKNEADSDKNTGIASNKNKNETDGNKGATTNKPNSSGKNTENEKNTGTADCEHTYVSSTTEKATCTNKGILTYTCTKCGDVYTEDIAKLEHSYTVKETTGTCEEGLKMIYECQLCGKQKEEDAAPAEHVYEVTEVVDATCTQDGTVTKTCSVCGNVETEIIKALGHTEGEPEVLEKPTLFKEGRQQISCIDCGEIVSDAANETIPAVLPISKTVCMVLVVVFIAIIVIAVVIRKKRK